MGILSSITNLLTGGSGKAVQGIDQGIAAQERMFQTARGDLAPYRDFGQNYLAKISDLVANRRRIRPEDVTSLPGYQFRLNQGREAVENSAIARGGLKSGNAMRALMEYGQDYASDEYERALAREEGMFQNDYGNLLNLANIGYGAAGGSAGLAAGHGNALAQLYASRGQAKAQGYRFPMELGAAGAGAYLSDRRAKTDISKVGETADGLSIYKFRYKGDSELRLGVMADEVEKVKPWAVFKRADGLRMVDYSQIGVANG